MQHLPSCLYVMRNAMKNKAKQRGTTVFIFKSWWTSVECTLNLINDLFFFSCSANLTELTECGKDSCNHEFSACNLESALQDSGTKWRRWNKHHCDQVFIAQPWEKRFYKLGWQATLIITEWLHNCVHLHFVWTHISKLSMSHSWVLPF